eukprot:181776_1
MVGEAEGIYHAKIHCVSDSPTKRPSYAPLKHPITAHTTRRPSMDPSSTAYPSYLTTFADNSNSDVPRDTLPMYLIMIGSLIAVVFCIVCTCLCIILVRKYEAKSNVEFMQQGAKVMDNNKQTSETTTGSGQARGPTASLFVAKQGTDAGGDVFD